MKTNAAIRTLNADLKRYRRAESNESKQVAGEKKAAAAVRSDAAAEKGALQTIASQRQAILDEFSSAPPPDAATTQKLLGQMYTLGEQAVQTKDAYTNKIAADKATVGRDAKAAARDEKLVKADRKTALKDLTPAEYHMNLKDTNRVRKELGLKEVKHVIRPPANGLNAVAYAKRYLGFPYNVGSSGPRQFDCSGFVKWVYNHNGLPNFPTYTGNQDVLGHEVAQSSDRNAVAKLQPGDLLFLRTGDPRFTDQRGFGHVGIYMGNGVVISATGHARGVAEDPISSWGSWEARRYPGID